MFADDANELDGSQEVALVSTNEARNMLQSLKTFGLQHDGDDTVFILLRRMQEKIKMFRSRQMPQKSIHDFQLV